MSAFYNVDRPPFNMGSVARAIAAANNGLLFDPSDMSTMFQDAAGTIPVTAVEQPVGKILDKSGNGNHATQSVTASRPTLSARYNLLTKTEDFADAAWVKARGGTGAAPAITSNHALAPDGTMTAARVIFARGSGATSSDYSVLFEQLALSANVNFNESIYVKLNTGAASIAVYAALAGSGVLLGTKIIDISNQWVRIDTSFITTSTGNHNISIGIAGSLIGTTQSADILIWHPQLNIGTTPLPYQRVNTATDYDTDPRYFPKYLKFDGVDDYLNLPFMNLYGGGAASIIAARNAVSQATDTYIISERSTANANPKYFPSRQLASGGNMDAYISDDTAAVVLDTAGSAFSGASDKVIRSVVDTGNNIKLFKNGALAADDNYTRSGTLTLNNTTIGASVSTTTGNYASMKLYGLIVTKSALTDAQRIACERHLSRKAGVVL